MFRRLTIWLSLLAVVLGWTACPLRGDVLHLTNGRQISGTIVRQTDESVVLEIGGQFKITIRRDQIAKIDLEDPVTVKLREAKGYMTSKQFDRAAGRYRDVLNKHPDNEAARVGYLEALNLWARQLLALKRYDECSEVVAEIRRLRPDDPRIDEVARLVERAAHDVSQLEGKGDVLLTAARYAEAIEHFEQARQIMPTRKREFDRKLARAFAGRGDQHFKTGNLEKATDMYRRALALDPAIDRSIVARYVVAQVSLLITELNRAEGPVGPQRAREMVGQLRHLLELQPDSVHANYLFGLLNHGLGHKDVAREAYLAVLADHPQLGNDTSLAVLQEMAQKVSSGTAVAFGTDAEEALRKKILPGPMREYRHGGFIVKHRNEVIARRVALAAEYHARRLFDLFGIKRREDLWPVPCTIILHPDHETYARQEKQPGWSPAVARFRRRGGKLETLELATYQQAVELIPCVVPHELTHLVIDSVFPNRKVPLWLNEGLAVSQEQDYKKQHLLGDMLNHVRMKTDIPFDDLVTRTTYPKPELVDTYYAQSLVLTEVLLQAGDMARLRRFVDLVQDEPLDDALRGSFDLSLAELERRYRAAVSMVDRRLNRSVVQPVE